MSVRVMTTLIFSTLYMIGTPPALPQWSAALLLLAKKLNRHMRRGVRPLPNKILPPPPIYHLASTFYSKQSIIVSNFGCKPACLPEIKFPQQAGCEQIK